MLGKDHLDTLISIRNLASSLGLQGKPAEAEAILRQTLQLKEKALGKEHPDTLRSMKNLVILLNQQGKFAEAEAIRQIWAPVTNLAAPLDTQHAGEIWPLFTGH